jgi:DNA-binding transcriptional MerR regulator
MEKYKSADVIKITRVTKVQLNHWINMGAIKPLVDDKRRGGVRYFSKQNLVQAFICKHLNEYGLPVHKIKMALDMIKDTKSISGKNFYDAIKDNPKLKSYYAAILPVSGIGDKGEVLDTDSEIFEKDIPQIKKDLKIDLPHAEQWKIFAKELVGALIATEDDLLQILSQNPTAIVINLNAYVKTVGGL